MQPINIGIIGGTGYTGLELLRLLAGHPCCSVTAVTSRGEDGKKISDLFPSLWSYSDLRFSDPRKAGLENCDLVFSAAANGVAMTHAKFLLDNGVKLIDLSADFRIKDVVVWEHWYGMKHQSPELVEAAVYGLPERNRERIKTAGLVANPGCYPTAIQLGFMPLLEEGLIDAGTLIADAKSGVSGAGRAANTGTAFAEVSDSFKAYAASGHRHLPEIRQELQSLTTDRVDLVFIPHLLPIIRGIHATLYARLSEKGRKLSAARIREKFLDRYNNEMFVTVMAPESHPDTKSVRGSNHCRLSVHRPENGNTIVVLAVEDNLVKGAAGQAIQNMNLMFGLEEDEGLKDLAMVP